MIHLPGKQRGVALLVVMLIAVLALGTLILHTREIEPRALIEERDTLTLSMARDALMGFAQSALNGQRPGDMMYPDALNKTESPRNYDGRWDGGCYDRSKNDGTLISSGENMRCLGRLPWSDLNLQLPDSSEHDPTGVMPWYAVSANLVDPCLKAINPGILDLPYPGSYPAGCPGTPTDTQLPHPWLTVRDSMGNVISDRVAFVVIIPGPPLGTQNRPASPHLGDAREYLDSYVVRANSAGCPNGAVAPCTFRNDDLDNDFIIGDPNDPQNAFNDRLLFVTVDELVAAAEKRALVEAAAQLRTFYRSSGNGTGSRYYPYASLLGDGYFNCQEGNRRGHLPLNNGCQCYCTNTECGCRNCPAGVLDNVAFTSTGKYFTSGGQCTSTLTQCTCQGNGWCSGTDLNVGNIALTVNAPLPFSVDMIAPVAAVSTIAVDVPFSASQGSCSRVGSTCQCSGTGQPSQIGRCSGASSQSVNAPYRYANTSSGSIKLTQTTCSHSVPAFPAWFTDNNWSRYIYYTLDAKCSIATPGCAAATLTAGGQIGLYALLIGTGRPLQLLPSPNPKQQGFPSTNVADYLDSAENTNGDDVYDGVEKSPAPNYNDRIVIICPGDPSCP